MTAVQVVQGVVLLQRLEEVFVMYRLRLKFQKVDQLKFVSHLELMRVMERTFRRLELPLKFTQGFNPHPKISYAAPLSVGVSSDSEYVDVELVEKVNIDQVIADSAKELPNGLKFLDGKYVETKKSLMSITAYSTYAVQVNSDSVDEAFCKKQVESFLKQKEINAQQNSNKKKKEVTKNIRELILDVQLLTIQDEKLIFKMFLKTGSEGNIKPEVVLTHLDGFAPFNMDLKSVRTHRLALFGDKDGKPVDILEM